MFSPASSSSDIIVAAENSKIKLKLKGKLSLFRNSRLTGGVSVQECSLLRLVRHHERLVLLMLLLLLLLSVLKVVVVVKQRVVLLLRQVILLLLLLLPLRSYQHRIITLKWEKHINAHISIYLINCTVMSSVIIILTESVKVLLLL